MIEPALSLRGATKSTLDDRFCGESFCPWDIQFDYPQIRVPRTAAVPIFRNFFFFISILWTNSEQLIATFRADPALKSTGIHPSFQRDDQDRPCLGVAAREHGADPSCVIHPPEQGTDEQVARQPGAQGSVRYPGSPASAIRLRMKVPVPRAASSPSASISRASATNTRR